MLPLPLLLLKGPVQVQKARGLVQWPRPLQFGYIVRTIIDNRWKSLEGKFQKKNPQFDGRFLSDVYALGFQFRSRKVGWEKNQALSVHYASYAIIHRYKRYLLMYLWELSIIPRQQVKNNFCCRHWKTKSHQANGVTVIRQMEIYILFLTVEMQYRF